MSQKTVITEKEAFLTLNALKGYVDVFLFSAFSRK
jgi:hypothetical protein